MPLEPQDLWATSRDTSLRLAAYDGGSAGGPAVVVLHGLVTGIDVLRSAISGFDPYARLAREGLNVLALDWPGHGRSGGPRGHLTYRAAMDAAAVAVARARERWGGPVGLFGTAFGGVLAFYAALEGQDVGAVACHNVLDLRDIRPVLQRARQGLLLPVAGALHRWLPEARQQHVPIPAWAVVATADLADEPALSRALRRHPQSVRRYTLSGLGSVLLRPEDKPDVSAQSVPTFVAVGSNDRVLPETTTRAFVSRVTADGQLWVLPGGGHQLLLEHPEALVPAAASFLKERLV